MTLPADSHVHTEWSWDTTNASMERSCARAVDLGVPVIAFTEHLDHTVWTVDPDASGEHDPLRQLTDPDGTFTPPPFDVTGYLGSIERCRDRYPDLRILTGLELGEPHWHAGAVAEVLGAEHFDRVLGSLHCLPDESRYAEPPGLYAHRDPDEVIQTYLAEVTRLISESDAFSVLAHIDYPVRSWPDQAPPFDPRDFEDEFRHTLRTLGQSGRARRSTPGSPCTHRSCVGGTTRGVRRSPSAATRTSPPPWHEASSTQHRWRRRTAFVRGGTHSTSGDA